MKGSRTTRSISTTRAILAFAAALWVSPLSASHAQDWPSRPIRVLIPAPPGGSSDIAARSVADRLSQRLGKPVLVEPAPGGGGVIASDQVARAAPDGHTIVMLTAGHPGTAALRKQLPFDPVDGFSMISMVMAYPLMVMVARDSPVQSLSDLLARAKAEPGKVTYSANAPGTLLHLAAEWINAEAGTSMTHVPYRGGAQAMTDLLTMRVDAGVDTPVAAISHLQSGSLRALAVTSKERFALFPQVPAVAETLPAIDAVSWLGLALPPNTSRTIVDRLNAEIKSILETAEIKELFHRVGAVPSYSTPEQMRSQIVREIATWNRIVDQKKLERQ